MDIISTGFHSQGTIAYELQQSSRQPQSPIHFIVCGNLIDKAPKHDFKGLNLSAYKWQKWKNIFLT